MLGFPSQLCVRMFLLAAVLVPAVVAQNVYINSSLVTITTGPAVVGARYRLSNTGVDQILHNGNNNVASAGQSLGLGNVSQLSGKTFDFSLQHTVAGGFVYSLKRLDTNTTTTVDWTNSETFTSLDAIGHTNDRAFNTLHLFARAQQTGAVVEFSNLAFSGATTIGSFDANDAVNGDSGGPAYSGVASSGSGTYDQWLYSDTNFASYDWTLTGTLKITKTGIGGDESVKFDIDGKASTVSVVPEPSFYASLALGFSGLVFAVRRRRQQR